MYLHKPKTFKLIASTTQPPTAYFSCVSDCFTLHVTVIADRHFTSGYLLSSRIEMVVFDLALLRSFLNSLISGQT